MKQIFKNVMAIAAVTTLLVACENKAKTTETTVEQTTVEPTTVEPTTETTATNWVGEYEGTVPCASCPGIKTEVKLNSDNSYELEQEYLEKGKDSKYEYKGQIAWSEDKTIITLGDTKFKVGENQLMMLNSEGKEAEENAAAYVLRKKQ